MDRETASGRNHETDGRIFRIIQQIKGLVDAKTAARLQLDLIERMARRLAAFDCADCKAMLARLDQQVMTLAARQGRIDKPALKEHDKLVGGIRTHLTQKHQLITEGYYMSIYMSMGMSLGLVFGLAVFKNLALGLPIGLAVGLAIGNGLDADAKKKDKVI